MITEYHVPAINNVDSPLILTDPGYGKLAKYFYSKDCNLQFLSWLTHNGAKVNAKSVLTQLPENVLYWLSSRFSRLFNMFVRCILTSVAHSWCTQCIAKVNVNANSVLTRLPEDAFIDFIFSLACCLLVASSHQMQTVDAHSASTELKSVLTLGCQRMSHVNGRWTVHHCRN